MLPMLPMLKGPVNGTTGQSLLADLLLMRAAAERSGNHVEAQFWAAAMKPEVQKLAEGMGLTHANSVVAAG